MPIKESELKYLVDKIVPHKRARIERAIRYEEEKTIERALEVWEELIAEARKEGKDVSVLQNRIQNLHKLWWQKERVQGKGPLDALSHVEERDRGKAKEKRTTRSETYKDLKNKLRLELQNRCLKQGVNLSFTSQENRLIVRGILDRLLKERLEEIPEWVSRRDLMESVVADVLGLGILDGYLKDPSVTEILVQGTDLFYEKNGKLSQSPGKFNNIDEVREIIDRLLNPIGRRVDEVSPLVDAKLPDGSRLNIILPPVALDGPSITVRKIQEDRHTEEFLLQAEGFSRQMADFFRMIVCARKNIVVAGRASSGKTTLLNLLGSYIPEQERIITIEEAAELQLPQSHVVRLEARPPDIRKKGEITTQMLFQHALHMRPDRIVVGECRGAEMMDIMQALNTGLDGFLCTAHANAPADLLDRLEIMVGLSGSPASAPVLRKQIAAAMDVVIFCTRHVDGRRKVSSVCEIRKGGEPEVENVLQEIYRFEPGGMDEAGSVSGSFFATGAVPAFIQESAELSGRHEILALFRQDG